tara:strand:- start:1716 stop:1835 length:120 start_codon:yes stop_codon:yes gene_type:complete
LRGHLRPIIAWITSKKIKLYFPGYEKDAKIWVMLEGEEE